MSYKRATKVAPLRARTMTLEQLQKRTLKVLRLVRKQFNRAAHEDGLSDKEFLDQVVDVLEWDIKSDIAVLNIHEERKAAGL